MTFPSNHSSGCSTARQLTSVGLMRPSTGPAMSVRLRGRAGSSSSAMSAVAASACTHGWQTAIMCAPGPITRRNSMRWSV